jgi:YndJ-like protein
LASLWFGFGCLAGFCGLLSALRGGIKSLKTCCMIVSLLYLPVGCAWLFASRLGLTPMNFQEPIVLLTAVHFHFAGFAAPLLARAAESTFRQGDVTVQRIFRAVAAGVLTGPGMLAAGFVLGPRAKLLAAILVASSEIGLALMFLIALRGMRPRIAQALVGISAGSVLFAMILAGAWAIGEFPLQPFVHLDEMAKFHGTANALGFALCGLAGWNLSCSGRARAKEK